MLPELQGIGGASSRRRAYAGAGPMIGIQGWTATNNYMSAANAAPLGTTALTTAVLFYYLGPPSSTDEVTCLHGPVSGVAGGHNIWQSSGNLLGFAVVDGGGTVRTSPRRTMAATDAGKVFLGVGVYNNVDVRFYVQGALIGGGGTASVGYTVPNAGVKTAIGVGSTSGGAATLPSGSYRIVGSACANATALSAAQVATLFADCQAQNDLATFPGMTHRWRASQNVGLATSWVDDTGGVTLTKTGTLIAVRFAPLWG